LHLVSYSGCRIEQLSTIVTRFWNTTQHYRRAYAHLIDPSGRELIKLRAPADHRGHQAR